MMETISRCKKPLYVSEDLTVNIPPYLPDTELVRKDIRQMYSFLSIEMEDFKSQSYYIYSISGKLLYFGQINSRNKMIDLSNLSPNMYLLRIENRVLKFVKTK